MRGRTVKKVSVVLMTYGSPSSPDLVPQYLKNVFGGKKASSQVSKEFQRRYKLIGGSPLIAITQKQAAKLQEVLNRKSKDAVYKVKAGMRFSEPFIASVVEDIGRDCDILVGIIMSPQYSPVIMSGYVRELTAAVKKLRRSNVELRIATDWHMQPFFLQALAQRVKEVRSKLPAKVRDNTQVLFSAHSMPKRVVDEEPGYIRDLQETASEVAKLARLQRNKWMFCYQSAGHTPEEWLKPDFADIMPALAAKKQTHVVIAPVQFLADHLEILYDVEIAARQQAEKNGISFSRTSSLNTLPLFIKALAAVVQETLYRVNYIIDMTF